MKRDEAGEVLLDQLETQADFHHRQMAMAGDRK
jgi:hypothetical protein